MNERERGVCARVKLFREDIKWPQSDFAAQIGITKDKLVSIEYGRTPLRYKTGVDLCEVFGVNADWIVTGQGEMRGGAPILWEIEFPFEHYEKKLFSEVFDLAPNIFQPVKRVFGLVEGPTPGFNAEAYLLRKVPRWFSKQKFRTPLEAERFARSVNDFAEEALQSLVYKGMASQKRLSQLKAEHEAAKRKATQVLAGTPSSKDIIDKEKPADTVAGVRLKVPTWIQLKKDIARFTAERGEKAALAAELGVSRQVLGNWLSDDAQGAPNAELTLRLLDWVIGKKKQIKTL